MDKGVLRLLNPNIRLKCQNSDPRLLSRIVYFSGTDLKFQRWLNSCYNLAIFSWNICELSVNLSASFSNSTRGSYHGRSWTPLKQIWEACGKSWWRSRRHFGEKGRSISHWWMGLLSKEGFQKTLIWFQKPLFHPNFRDQVPNPGFVKLFSVMLSSKYSYNEWVTHTSTRYLKKKKLKSWQYIYPKLRFNF